MKILFVLFHLSFSCAFATDIKLISGQAAWDLLFAKVAAEFESKSGHKIVLLGKLETTSSNDVYKSVLKGEADFGAGPLGWEDWTKTLLASGETQESIKSVAARTVGRDNFQVFVHPEIGNVGELNAKQMKGLIDGTIKSWKEVGGNDVPPVFVLHFPTTNDLIKKLVLGGGDFDKDTIDAKTIPKMQETVTSTKGAFGMASTAVPPRGTKTIQINPVLGRPITGITLGKPKPHVEEFFKFLIKKAGL